MEKSAGAVLYEIKNNEINYLLILDFNGNWGFPKGHLENGETNEQAALREIKEEVGIDAIIDNNFIRELVYIMPNGIEKHSLYYIGRYSNQIPTKQLEEIKEIRILPYSKALNLISFDNMKQVLIEANNYIESTK